MRFNRNIFLIIATLAVSVIVSSQIYSWSGNPADIPVNPGFPINTEGDDFSPSITEDGNIMVFNSKLPSEKSHNIYICRLGKNGWGKPEYMKEINSTSNDETPFITPDGKTLLFSSDREGSMRPSKTADGRIRITFDIYISHFINGKWTKPRPVNGDVNTILNERSPSMSRDKKILYFTRWPFMRLKDSVIMQAEFHYDRYIHSTPLPGIINSDNYDIAIRPSVNRPGFFFSSRRPGGFGGWDLYFIEYRNGYLGEPINLGKGINSINDEIALTETGDMLYFCSNRSNGLGRYDIYASRTPSELKKVRIGRMLPRKIEKSPDKKYLPAATSGIIIEERPAVSKQKAQKRTHKRKSIYDESTDGRTKINFRIIKKHREMPVSAKIKVYLKDSENPRKKALRSVDKTSDPEGNFSVFPKKDVKWIVIKIREKGFRPLRSQIKVIHGKEANITIELEQAEGNQRSDTKSLFRPIFFRFNSAAIEMKYYPGLHKILDYMRKNPKSRILITGHADMYGRHEVNKKMSLKRAKAIRNYFEKMGINVKRITIKGMGNLKPLRCVAGKHENRVNRRVEFRMR